MLKTAIPLLHVSNAALAEDFYCNGLGFRRLFAYRSDETQPDPCFMGLVRDAALLHISSFSGDAVAGGVVSFLVDEVDGLYAELNARHVAIAMPPTDQTWGNREMYVKDADGNSLRFIREGGS
jgi:uncharacterized glyoxalase superfamily protein PhnB